MTTSLVLLLPMAWLSMIACQTSSQSACHFGIGLCKPQTENCHWLPDIEKYCMYPIEKCCGVPQTHNMTYCNPFYPGAQCRSQDHQCSTYVSDHYDVCQKDEVCCTDRLCNQEGNSVCAVEEHCRTIIEATIPCASGEECCYAEVKFKRISNHSDQ